MCLCEEMLLDDGHDANLWVLNSRKCEPAIRILLSLAQVYKLGAQRMLLLSGAAHKTLQT